MNRAKQRGTATPIVLVLVLATSCTDSHLYGIGSQPNFADRISLQGEVCTDDPSAVDFPVKVLVVIDGSAALVGADPMASRAVMLRTLVDRWAAPNYHFGFLQFAAQTRNLTSGFATDTMDIQPALDAIGIGSAEAARNYLDALRATSIAVQDDLLASTPGTRSRTRYVVLFIAGGPPTPALEGAWCLGHGFTPGRPACHDNFTAEFCGDIQPTPDDCEEALYRRNAADLRRYALDRGAADLVFNTFALTTDARTNELLTQMAFASQGTFAQQKPDGLNLLRTDIAASSSVLQQRGLVVYNPNMMLRSGHPVPDSDGDGLSDDEERALGTDPTRGDTDGDFVGDAIEVRLAAPGLQFDPRSPHVPDACLTIDPPDRDSDGDSLMDCEEAVLRTDASLVDTDRDAIPDIIEVRRGSDPLADDLLTDSDADGIPNGIQVSEGMGAQDGAAQYALEYGYRYRIQELDGGETVRLEALPRDPVPGVIIETIDGSLPTVGTLRYLPGPPATLAWADDQQKGNFGAAVDVSAGGAFELVSAGMRKLGIKVTPAALPPPSAGTNDQKILVRPTLRSCIHYDVRNITLAPTIEVAEGRPGAGWNNLQVYLAALPKAAPHGFHVFDLATVPVRFLPPDRKTPNLPFITLDRFSFLPLGGAQ